MDIRVIEAAVRHGKIHTRLHTFGGLTQSEEAFDALQLIHEKENESRAPNQPTVFPTQAWNWWVIPPETGVVNVYYWAEEAIIGFTADDEKPLAERITSTQTIDPNDGAHVSPSPQGSAEAEDTTPSA